jgi:RND family efflux transporter MFP subunit
MCAKQTSGRVLLKLGVVIVVLAGIGFAALRGLQKTARVKAVERSTAVDAVTGSVFVDADGGTHKELKAEAEGKVAESASIVRGKRFKKDDVLLQLDTADYVRQVEDYRRRYLDEKKLAHIRLTSGKPQLLAGVEKLTDEERARLYREVSPTRKLVVEKLAQAKRLFELNSISAEALREAERALENLDLQLQIDALNERRGEVDFKVTMENHQLQLDRMQIRAPDDGEITEANIWNGALIGRGHVVGKFMSHARVVSAKISEESFGRVRVGQVARVRLLTHGDREFDATVSKLLPNADEGQRFTAFLDVKVDSAEQLRPGSTGEVTITVDARPNALMIARRALFDSDKVFVVKHGQVELRTVKVGYLALNVAQVKEGLAEGELVIVDELDQFRAGDRVKPEPVR